MSIYYIGILKFFKTISTLHFIILVSIECYTFSVYNMFLVYIFKMIFRLRYRIWTEFSNQTGWYGF